MITTVNQQQKPTAPDYVADLPGTCKRIGGRVYRFEDYRGCDVRKYMKQIQDGAVIHVYLLNSRNGKVTDFVANLIGQFVAQGFKPSASYFPEHSGQVLPVEDCDQPEASQ